MLQAQDNFLFPSSLSPSPVQRQLRGDYVTSSMGSLSPRSSASAPPSPPVSAKISPPRSPTIAAITPIAPSRTAIVTKESFQSFKAQNIETLTCIQKELADLKSSLAYEIRSSRDDIWRELQRSERHLLAKQDDIEKFLKNQEHAGKVVQPGAVIKETVGNIDEYSTILPERQQTHSQGLVNETSANSAFTLAPESEVVNDQLVKQSLDAQKRWSEFELELAEHNPHGLTKEAVDAAVGKSGSLILNLFAACGQEQLIAKEMPINFLSNFTENHMFMITTTSMIIANMVLMGYETHLSIVAVLQQPRGSLPEWVEPTNSIFNYAFLAETLFRILALRSWFFVCPEWRWNVFDCIVVVVSIVIDSAFNMKVSYIRSLRLMRAFRVVRVVRVLRFFRELRMMLFAILACLTSLVWTFVFMCLIIFIFSVLFLQGLTNALSDMDPNVEEYRVVHHEVEDLFSTLPHAMLSLSAAVSGGEDWIRVRSPLVHAGPVYTAAFMGYVIFVTVGVMNVLTGVFLNNAQEFTDQDLIVQSEKVRVEQEVDFMLQLFKSVDKEGVGQITREQFHDALQEEYMQAYLSAYNVEVQHVHLLCDMLLEDSEKKSITATAFVTGMLKMKGEAKALDVRILRKMIQFVEATLKPLSDQAFSRGVSHTI